LSCPPLAGELKGVDNFEKHLIFQSASFSVHLRPCGTPKIYPDKNQDGGGYYVFSKLLQPITTGILIALSVLNFYTYSKIFTSTSVMTSEKPNQSNYLLTIFIFK
jgi:hypothetical protein